MVNTGGARPPETALQPRNKWRWPSKMYMDGPGIITLTMEIIPQMIQRVLGEAKLTEADIDVFLMHQATHKLLDSLRRNLQLDEDRMPTALRDYGNTVSSTIPILVNDLRASGRYAAGHAQRNGGLWRRLFLGRLRVDRDLGKQGCRRQRRRAGSSLKGARRSEIVTAC